MARFFINRPIFAWVIAICIMLAGLFSVSTLPVSQYPTIAPPSVSIDASYPGADAATVERSVTQIIEQNMTGLDGYMYMSSTSMLELLSLLNQVPMLILHRFRFRIRCNKHSHSYLQLFSKTVSTYLSLLMHSY